MDRYIYMTILSLFPTDNDYAIPLGQLNVDGDNFDSSSTSHSKYAVFHQYEPCGPAKYLEPVSQKSTMEDRFKCKLAPEHSVTNHTSVLYDLPVLARKSSEESPTTSNRENEKALSKTPSMGYDTPVDGQLLTVAKNTHSVVYDVPPEDDTPSRHNGPFDKLAKRRSSAVYDVPPDAEGTLLKSTNTDNKSSAIKSAVYDFPPDAGR